METYNVFLKDEIIPRYSVECAGIALQEGTGQVTFYNKEGIVLAIFPNNVFIIKENATDKTT
jgi:hypothetical protein